MRICTYLVIYLCGIGSVAAAGPPVRQTLTLDRVLTAVLENNPKLLAGDYEAQAAAAQIRKAQQSTPMHVRLELENFAGTGQFHADDLLETTLSFGKVLELGNKADLRGDVARQEAALLNDEKDAERLDILAEAARRFVHIIVDQERLAIAGDKLALSQRTAAIVAERVKVGRSPESERRRAKIAVARAETQLEHARHELEISRLELATLWGSTQPEFGNARAAFFVLGEIAPFEELARQLEKNPELARYATEQRLAESRLQLALSQRRGNIELSGGVRHFNTIDDSALVFSASIPLGTRARAKPGVETSTLLSERTPLLQEQRQLELYASLFAVHQELMHARAVARTLRERIIPEAELALADYEKGYRSGRYSLLELSDAQTTLLEARLEAVMAAADYHRLRIEVERLTGQAMSMRGSR